MNYCRDCLELLLCPTEWRFGFCLVCLSIRLEKMDEEVRDLWFEEDYEW